ncbi:MAG: archease [Candidatus Heimdallarchaeota archaeon]|nr:archease [Candidatus Heimdallarchaeota archaeon]
MFKYTILDDEVKSDFAFEVTADSLSELFRGAGIASMVAMVNLDTVKTTNEWNFEISAENESMLLYDFLSELVYLKDAETVLFKDFEISIEKNEDFKLKCKAFGSQIDWENEGLLTDVKAVTLYEFWVEKKENQWSCHVVLDL